MVWVSHINTVPGGVPCSCCPLYCPTCLRQTATGLPRRPAAAAGRPAGPPHLPPPGPLRRPAAPTPTAGRRPGPATLRRSTWRGCARWCRMRTTWPGPATAPSSPKSGRKLPGTGWRWHNGEGRVAWGQQFELLSVPGPGRALFLSRPRLPAARVGPPFPPVGAPLPAAAGRGGGHAGAAGRGPGRGAPPRHRRVRGRRPLRLRADGQGAGRTGPESW